MNAITVTGDRVMRIRNQLGPCVLPPIPLEEKGPRARGWRKPGLAEMTPSYLSPQQ